MRKSIHTADIKLRVSERLIEQIRDAADRKGMSLSEFTRHAIRRELEAA
jgi:predicted DNA binding CopG/RHH family protein